MKKYGKKTALNGVSGELNSPALIGLLGPNGAGKSTLMKLLTLGLLPTQGNDRAGWEAACKTGKGAEKQAWVCAAGIRAV